MTAECGQAVLDCICMDDDVLKGIGAARQLQNIVGDAPDELVKLLKQGPAQHLQQHAYEYRCKFDVELASIRRLKELQVTASRPQLPMCDKRPASLATSSLSLATSCWCRQYCFSTCQWDRVRQPAADGARRRVARRCAGWRWWARRWSRC
jgi:hypothetical protein